MDAGTAAEIGYLHARRKPMSGWTTETATFGERIRTHCGPTDAADANGTGATSGLERDVRGLLVHSSELLQHGMAQMPTEMSGGRVFSDGFGWSRAFRAAAADLAARVIAADTRKD